MKPHPDDGGQQEQRPGDGRTPPHLPCQHVFSPIRRMRAGSVSHSEAGPDRDAERSETVDTVASRIDYLPEPAPTGAGTSPHRGVAPGSTRAPVQGGSPVQRVTPHVFTSTEIRGCNPSYVVTSAGVVVIDTPQLPTKAVAMRQEAEEHGPIRFVINTEHHVDHIFGNYWFKGAGEVVHHQGVADNFMVPTPDLDPFAYALEAIPTDDPDAARHRPRPRHLLRGPEPRRPRVHRRPGDEGRRHDLPPDPHARAHPRPGRRLRARASASSSPATPSSPSARPG